MPKDVKKFAVNVQFVTHEIAAIDYVARLLNPATPKRTEAVRHLLALGYERFIQTTDVRPLLPAPPAFTVGDLVDRPGEPIDPGHGDVLDLPTEDDG